MSDVKQESHVARIKRPLAMGDLGDRSTRPDIAMHAFANLVDREPLVGMEAIAFIRSGVPATMLKSASGYFGLSESAIYKIMRVPPTTAHRLQKAGGRFDPAATERIYRMIDVTRMAKDVFEDQNVAREWLKRPSHSLGGATPLEMLDTEPGAISVRQVLNAIATGGVA